MSCVRVCSWDSSFCGQVRPPSPSEDYELYSWVALRAGLADSHAVGKYTPWYARSSWWSWLQSYPVPVSSDHGCSRMLDATGVEATQYRGRIVREHSSHIMRSRYDSASTSQLHRHPYQQGNVLTSQLIGRIRHFAPDIRTDRRLQP